MLQDETEHHNVIFRSRSLFLFPRVSLTVNCLKRQFWSEQVASLYPEKVALSLSLSLSHTHTQTHTHTDTHTSLALSDSLGTEQVAEMLARIDMIKQTAFLPIRCHCGGAPCDDGCRPHPMRPERESFFVRQFLVGNNCKVFSV